MNQYDQPPYRGFDPQARAKERQTRARQRNAGTAVLCAVVMLLSLCVLAVSAWLMVPQLTGERWKKLPNVAFVNGEIVKLDAAAERSYQKYSEYLRQDTLYPGIYVNGIHVGGLTKEEAAQQLREAGAAGGEKQAFSVTVNAGDHSWVFSPEQVPVSDDLQAVLEEAYAIGRADVPGAGRTPFERRCAVAAELRVNPTVLTTKPSYDVEAVKALVSQIAAYVSREPVNAEIAGFDYRSRSFSFTQSSPGCSIDEEELTAQVCAAVEKWREGETVTARVNITEPTVTTQELEKGFCLVAAYTTSTTSDENRNTNIRLACEAINGTALMPGETFSFNTATGQRTTDKGYREAGAISRGQSIEEVGGGICQVSSTLFNAVARANLEIVSRHPHAWPSTYVTIGQDATVNWPDLDFKFKNNTNYPVFVITYYKNRKLSAEIWGMTLGEGVTLDLESVTVQTLKAPTEIQYTYNGALPYGSEKTTVKARDGYVVDTYRVWYQNGAETRREKAYSTTYKAYQQVNEYNYGY